jgi:CubicO group peptidase (beta-lactamase class C family)
MRKLVFFCTALFVCASGPAACAQAQSSKKTAASAFASDSAILAIIKDRVDSKRSTGIVVGLLEPDGRTRIISYGSPGTGRPALDGNTVFEIGSITKVFTSTLLADMVLKGEVKLDDPVQKYLPEFVIMPTRNGKQITLAHLAEQNSGLPRMPTNFAPADFANPFADYKLEDLYEFLTSYELPRDPGEQYEYSNVGVGLLGHVLALRAKLSYEELVRTRILEPLGMKNTAITLTPWMQSHMALGHNIAGAVVPNWDIPTLAGAGALRSNANDMLKFLAANLQPTRKPLGPAMALAQKPRAFTTMPNLAMGLNWISRNAGADTIVWHNGGTGGFRTFVGIIPSKRTGVVVLTNNGGEGADDVGFHLLSPGIPLITPPVVKERVAIEVPENLLQRYVGRYEFTPTFAIEVTREGSILWGQATGQQKFRLWPEKDTEFFLKEFDAQVTFVVNPDGKVIGLVLHQGGKHPSAKRVE